MFGWVLWLGEGPRGGLTEGEAEFLVALRRVPDSGRWTSTGRRGREPEIPDPVQQARHNLHAVLRRLKGLPEQEDRWARAGYAIVLPDCPRPERDLGLHAPLRIFAFGEDMANLGPCL